MASTIDLNVYSDALVVLATAGIVIPLVRRLGINPVLGYLAAGAVLGPLGLGSFKDVIPALYWVTIVDVNDVASIAELGVVFLLFLIGLELSYDRLKAMRRLVIGLGGLQVIISTVAIAGIAMAAGLSAQSAIVLGACLACSSTAIVLEILSTEGRLTTRTGRTAFSVLLAQDIAVIPLLLFIAAVGDSIGHTVWVGLGYALLQATIVLAVIVFLGRVLMRPLFRLVANAHSTDLFIATVLFVIIGAGILSDVAGLSMALGAFVAGLLLAETEYAKAIHATIEPFKGLLLGIFFFTVGMSVNFRSLLTNPALLFGCMCGLVLLKASILAGLGKLFRLPWAAAIDVGLLLGAGGEFAFVGITLATPLGLFDQSEAGFALTVTTLSMVIIPLLSHLGRRLEKAFQPPLASEELAVRPPAGDRRAIIVGYGRVGTVVCDLMERHGIPFVAIDSDPRTVTKARQSRKDVYFGNADDPEFLKVCGIEQAVAVILTANVPEALIGIVGAVRSLRPDIPIISRARHASHAHQLYLAGVTEAVPETIEASLQLSEAALMALGIAPRPAIASIHEKRDEFRRQLQRAAKAGGRPAPTFGRPSGTEQSID